MLTIEMRLFNNVFTILRAIDLFQATHVIVRHCAAIQILRLDFFPSLQEDRIAIKLIQLGRRQSIAMQVQINQECIRKERRWQRLRIPRRENCGRDGNGIALQRQSLEFGQPTHGIWERNNHVVVCLEFFQA